MAISFTSRSSTVKPRVAEISRSSVGLAAVGRTRSAVDATCSARATLHTHSRAVNTGHGRAPSALPHPVEVDACGGVRFDTAKTNLGSIPAAGLAQHGTSGRLERATVTPQSCTTQATSELVDRAAVLWRHRGSTGNGRYPLRRG